MSDLRTEGKIRGFGVGLETLGGASDWLASGVSCIQAPFGILDPEAGEKVIPEALARGIPVIARGVFAGGFMANGSNQDEALLRSGQPELRSQVRALAATTGVDPMQLAAWFVTRQPGITTVLVGTTSELHLEESLRYLLCSPPPELVTIFDELRCIFQTDDATPRQAGGS
jgi:aryl-alcohol dehydrogenase-like predicted oxidoreductase